MSDNLTTPVASGAVLATDDVAGVQYPRVKVSFGVDGSAADVSSSSRFPVDVGTSIAVTQSGTWSMSAAQSGAWNITNITGTVSLPTGAATSALQTTGNTSLASILTALTGTLAISAASLPLPTGAATAANQATLNSTAADAAPAASAGPVTPSDTTTLTAKAIWVGGAGNVVATIGGTDVTFTSVAAGTLLPIKATKIKAATTATNIVWLGN